MNNSNTLCSQEFQVLVFKTNLTDSDSVQQVDEYLQSLKGIYHTSVDLEDWEKVHSTNLDRWQTTPSWYV